MTQNSNPKNKLNQDLDHKHMGLRICFSVTILYLYYFILSHTLVWQTVSLSAVPWLDLQLSPFNID